MGDSDQQTVARTQRIKPNQPPLYESSLQADKLHAQISDNEERAAIEEREGCFGQSEQCWKRAFAIAIKHFPEAKVTARVARSLGLFLHRFLPNSAQPIAYLRIAVDIERRIDRSSADATNALLDLSQALIACSDYCEEAESILNHLIAESKDTVLTLRATTNIGRIRIVQGSYIKAEEILRANAERSKAICPNSELLADILSLLGKVLVSLDRLPEGIRLLTESIAISKRRFPRLFLATFQRAITAFQSADMSPELHSFVRLTSEDITDLHPYIVGELFTIIAQSSFRYESITWYLRALAVYRSVRPQTWYVANALARVCRSFTPFVDGSLLAEAEKQLSSLMPALPAVSEMLRMPCDIVTSQYLIKQSDDKLTQAKRFATFALMTLGDVVQTDWCRSIYSGFLALAWPGFSAHATETTKNACEPRS